MVDEAEESKTYAYIYLRPARLLLAPLAFSGYRRRRAPEESPPPLKRQKAATPAGGLLARAAAAARRSLPRPNRLQARHLSDVKQGRG